MISRSLSLLRFPTTQNGAKNVSYKFFPPAWGKVLFSTVSSCQECSTFNRSWRVHVNHNRSFAVSFRDERPIRTTKDAAIGIGEESEEYKEKVRNSECKIVFVSSESFLSKSWMKELQEGKLGRQTIAMAIYEVHSVTEMSNSLFAHNTP